MKVLVVYSIVVCLCLYKVCGASMRDVVIAGGSFSASVVEKRGSHVGTSCQAPGGIINQGGDCVCCGGWSGPGCGRRDRCFDVSCANGGRCDPNTGFCMCPLSFTGAQCERPSCSFQGYYDAKHRRCTCNYGFAGADCNQCAVAPAGHAYVCVPTRSVLYDGYMLMVLPSSFAEQIVSGTKKPDATLSYSGIYPNAVGHNGKRYGCNCRLDSAAEDANSPSARNKRWISNGNLYLYNQTVVTCIADSTLTMQQMAELTSMWYQAYSLEQQGLLNNTWYIVGIIFIILFGLLLLGIIVYCAVKSYEGTVSESPFEEPGGSGVAATPLKNPVQGYQIVSAAVTGGKGRPYTRSAISSLKNQ